MNKCTKDCKKYILVDMNTDDIITFNSKNPREAALKAASKNFKDIVLVENGKIHIFQGKKQILTDKETNNFTQKNKIMSRPIVKKLAYCTIKHDIDVKKDLDYIKSKYQELTNIS